jgi:hypothetical protein
LAPSIGTFPRRVVTARLSVADRVLDRFPYPPGACPHSALDCNINNSPPRHQRKTTKTSLRSCTLSEAAIRKSRLGETLWAPARGRTGRARGCVAASVHSAFDDVRLASQFESPPSTQSPSSTQAGRMAGVRRHKWPDPAVRKAHDGAGVESARSFLHYGPKQS